MKKLLSAVLVVVLMLSLTSCDVLNDMLMSMETYEVNDTTVNNAIDNNTEALLQSTETGINEEPDFTEALPEDSEEVEYECGENGHRIEWIIDEYADQDRTGTAHGACRECGYESEKLLAFSRGLKYRSNGDGTCSVVGFDDDGRDEIVVPLTHNGERVTVISDGAFESLREIKEVFLPDGLEEIGSNAFSWCETMNFVNIPDTVRSIGDSAFWYCFEITELSIPTNIDHIGASAFGCTGITSIEISKANRNYHVDGRCLIETNTKTLIMGFGNSVIPSDESVEYIGNGAFAGCEELREITIPKSVKAIGPHAFYCCGNMTSITFEEGLEIIEYNAFNACHSLTELVFPESLNRIHDSAFTSCSGVEKIYMGDGIMGIGACAFNQCYSLKDIYYGGDASKWKTTPKGIDWDLNADDYTIHYNYGNNN